jgi:hypothetical protein
MQEVSGELTVIANTIWWFGKVRERLAVSKQTAQLLDGEKFNLRKPNCWRLENSIRLRLQFCSFGELK